MNSRPVVIKLSTGETLYGVCSDIDDVGVYLENPLTWDESIDEYGTKSTSLIRYNTGSDDPVVIISDMHVITMYPMDEHYTELYIAAVRMQTLTQSAYNKNISNAAKRISVGADMLEAANHAKKTGSIVAFKSSSNSTYH